MAEVRFTYMWILPAVTPSLSSDIELHWSVCFSMLLRLMVLYTAIPTLNLKDFPFLSFLCLAFHCQQQRALSDTRSEKPSATNQFSHHWSFL